MSMTIIAITLILVLFLALGAGLWISLSLLSMALIGFILIGNEHWGNIMATTSWSSVASWSLTPLPMFLWMGEILSRSKLSKNLFDGLSIWLDKVPGKLFHVNTLSCGIFAAVSGSSAATVATVGNITLPQLKRLGYKESFSIGLLGGSGTLGLLIPPSILLIIYGVAADISVARLFMAGVFPGILLIAIFMIYTIIYSLFNPSVLPEHKNNKISFAKKIKVSFTLFPVLALILFILGSIYTGLASPSEAAALGVIGSLILSAIEGSLSLKIFMQGIMAAVRTTSMLMFIIVCAMILTSAMGFIGLPRELVLWVKYLDLSPAQLLIALSLLFIVLGCFLDGISVILLTTSIILPMVEANGFNLIWFGIYLVIIVEMSQITPPVGFNLFVLQSLTRIDILTVARYTMPFFFLILLVLIILYLFPGLATWLPQKMTLNP